MKKITYNGAAAVIELIDSGVALDQICDRYGRPIHPLAHEFLSYHKQAKRMLLRQAYTNNRIKQQLLSMDPIYTRNEVQNQKHTP